MKSHNFQGRALLFPVMTVVFHSPEVGLHSRMETIPSPWNRKIRFLHMQFVNEAFSVASGKMQKETWLSGLGHL